jgi:hypothetical protein
MTLLAVIACHAQETNNVAEQEVNPSNSRELIRQWVQTEHIISEEKTAWQVEKQQMQELLEIYQQELKLLNEELNVAGSSADLIDENKEKLESGLAQYREAKQILRSSMASIVPRMQKLVGRFPAPLVEELGSDIDLISSPEALDKPRDVLKSVIAILNAAGSFNRTLTLSEETRTLANEKKITVSVLYLGLCRAYYAADVGPLAGTGVPAATGATGATGGWLWTEDEGIADQVRRTIAVHKKSAQPQLVELPVQLQSGESGE